MSRFWNRTKRCWIEYIGVNDSGPSWNKLKKHKAKLRSQRLATKIKCNTDALPTVDSYKIYKEKLIKNATPAEKKMKEILNSLQIPFKFQHVLGRRIRFYIVDFYLPQMGAIIEVDGPQHRTCEGQIKDKERSDYLRNNFQIGKIHRFQNWQIIKYPKFVYTSLAKKYRRNIYKAEKQIRENDKQFSDFISGF